MKRSGILVTVVGSALLMGGAMFKAPRVTANPSLLYLAGQAKMALGDTAGGLRLISRAAREQQAEQMPVPQAQPKQTMAAAQACSERTAVQAQQPTITAKAEPRKIEKKMLTVAAPVRAKQPKLVMAKMSFPADPFNGHQDVPGMTREQVARVRFEYRQQMQRWSEEQGAQQFEMAKLDRVAGRAAEAIKGRHPQFIKVIVPEAPVLSVFPPAPPRANP
jgi:hypothetical protein